MTPKEWAEIIGIFSTFASILGMWANNHFKGKQRATEHVTGLQRLEEKINANALASAREHGELRLEIERIADIVGANSNNGLRGEVKEVRGELKEMHKDIMEILRRGAASA